MGVYVDFAPFMLHPCTRVKFVVMILSSYQQGMHVLPVLHMICVASCLHVRSITDDLNSLSSHE